MPGQSITRLLASGALAIAFLMTSPAGAQQPGDHDRHFDHPRWHGHHAWDAPPNYGNPAYGSYRTIDNSSYYPEILNNYLASLVPGYQNVQGPPVTPTSSSDSYVGPDQALIIVDVPAPDAQVWLNGMPINQTGSTRQGLTPPIPPNQRYIYNIRVRWAQNGIVIDQTRPLAVRSNNRATIDFRQPE